MQHCIDSYQDLFINSIPLLDLRAPIEFKCGSFPNAVNIPIMDDKEREIIGKCYKHHGQKKAIQKGHELIKGKLRQERIDSWITFTKHNPNGYLYCFRGGLRSQIAQQWIHEAGVELPIVEGGYKALRTFLLDAMHDATDRCNFKLIGGKTGCGKTTLINQLNNSVDIEAAAYHRGSSFGRHAKPQNTQINFENILAIDFLKQMYQGNLQIILEDEARTIGKDGIPKSLFTKMSNSPLVVIEEPYDARLERLIQEYVIDMHDEFTALHGELNGFKYFSTYLLESLERIQKRLGPARYGSIYKNMQHALEVYSKSSDITKHYDWLSAVLDNYYDPMYQDQLDNKKGRIEFTGDYQTCLEFLQQSSC